MKPAVTYRTWLEYVRRTDLGQWHNIVEYRSTQSEIRKLDIHLVEA